MSLPEIGHEILGKYRINKRLGEGGMGVVYAATHMDLQETVAIKMLTPDLVRREEIVGRFMREARAAAKIKNDHAVRVLDVGKLEDGVPYMVMEFLEGEDLEHVLGRGPLQLRDAIKYVTEASQALGEAHRLGIVHRDIKPANLFLATKSNGTRIVKVLDFGISKVANDGLAGGGATRTEAVMGTPMYMSPEQLRSSRDVDARADVWSLGVVFYELLTGHFPFEGESIPVICASILGMPYKPIRERRPDLPVEIEAIVAQCLDKDRDKRFASVEGFVQALAPFAGTEGGAMAPIVVAGAGARSSGNWTQSATDATLYADAAPSATKGRPTSVIAAAIVALVVLVGGGVFAYSRLSGEPAATPEQAADNKPASTSIPSVVPAGQIDTPKSEPTPAATPSAAPIATATNVPAVATTVPGVATVVTKPGTTAPVVTATVKFPALKPTATNKVFDVGGRK